METEKNKTWWSHGGGRTNGSNGWNAGANPERTGGRYTLLGDSVVLLREDLANWVQSKHLSCKTNLNGRNCWEKAKKDVTEDWSRKDERALQKCWEKQRLKLRRTISPTKEGQGRVSKEQEKVSGYKKRKKSARVNPTGPKNDLSKTLNANAWGGKGDIRVECGGKMRGNLVGKSQPRYPSKEERTRGPPLKKWGREARLGKAESKEHNTKNLQQTGKGGKRGGKKQGKSKRGENQTMHGQTKASNTVNFLGT